VLGDIGDAGSMVLGIYTLCDTGAIELVVGVSAGIGVECESAIPVEIVPFRRVPKNEHIKTACVHDRTARVNSRAAVLTNSSYEPETNSILMDQIISVP
jgi:hypothetical protein